jgi:hypothetical protein
LATLDVVFDGPPGPESGRFVEVEVEGKSISLGTWVERPDKLWALQISTLDLMNLLIDMLKTSENTEVRTLLLSLRTGVQG